MDALTLTIAIACVTSVGGAVLGYLFHLEREQADELAADNSRLRDAIRSEAKKAEALSDEFNAVKRSRAEILDINGGLSDKIMGFKKRGYIRNAYGTLQRYADWLENGDKKPKPKPKKAKVAKAVKAKTPKAPKQLTRAEACLAILHEAKDAGFDWAQSAIDQFDHAYPNDAFYDDKTEPLERAVYLFGDWHTSKESFDYWWRIADSKEVASFKPKTQWPA